MKDRDGQILYVGKAKNLRQRVRQYFRPGDDDRAFIATGALGRVLATVDTIVVDNEKEALLLENHLIKEHRPRFNVKLRDDKQYLVLRIDPKKAYPRVEVVRNIKDDGARYFGPYHSATSCRETLRTVNRYFQLRTCTDHVLETRKRVCLQYQIKRCPGPCVYPVDESQYQDQVEDVMMFLAGKNTELVKRLKSRMKACSASENFEAAAHLRNSIYAVEKTLSRQNVVQESFIDQDVFGFWRQADRVEAALLFVRAGKFVGSRTFRLREQEFPDGEVLQGLVQQYYASGTFVPDEVLVAAELLDMTLLAEWLSSLRGRKVRILYPQRGQRVQLVNLANKNAENAASARDSKEQDTEETLQKLKKRLRLGRFPKRIECYDIAHIQGTSTVASMVVFVDGVPEKSLYRKFTVKDEKNDDFASMYEVIGRRFRRAQKGDAGWAPPDLLVVDGGKGQLSSAIAALRDAGVPTVGDKSFDVIALAKERGSTERPDRVFLQGEKDPIALRANTPELFVLARLRDEAHRFANSFHRSVRRKKMVKSALDDIPGIGAKRRTELLKHFGDLKRLRAATVDEIARVRGMTKNSAQAVYDFLRRESGE